VQSWTNSNASIGIATSGTGDIIYTAPNNTTGADITGTIVVTGSSNGCSSTGANQKTFTITIHPNPVVTNPPSQLQTTICSGGALNFLPTANTGVTTTYTWTSTFTGSLTGVTSTGSNTITDTPVNTGNSSGLITYLITPHFNSCTGSLVSYLVTVNPIPNASATNQTICSGQTTSIAITNPNSVSGTSFNWIVQSSSNVTGAVAGSGSNISQPLTSTDGVTTGSVTYAITPVSNGCSGTAITVTATVNPRPVITNTAVQLQLTICSGTPLNFTPTTTIAGTTFTWSTTTTGPISGVTLSGSGAITDSPANTGNVAGTVAYHIVPANGGCNGSSKDYVVTVQPVPSANGSDITICSGQTAIVPINATPQNVTGTTYSWIVIPSANVLGAAAGNGSTISQTLTLTNYSIGTVIYRVTPSANGCSGPTKDITVTVNPISLVNAGSDYAVCQPSSFILTGTIGGAATSGTWQIVSGNGSISGSSVAGTTVTATYTVALSDIATTATFRLITNDPDGAGPCVAVAGLVHVAINRAPTVLLPSDYTVCEPTSIPLTGTIGGSAATGLWSIVAGGGTLSATNVSGTTVTSTYTVAASDVANVVTFKLATNDPDGSGPCVAVSSNINITINRAARVFAPATLALCQNIPGIALGGSIGGSTTATVWTGGTGSFVNANNPNTVYNFKNPNEINTTVVLTLIGLDPDGAGPCTAVSTQTNLKINPLPIVAFSGFPAGSPPQMAENNLPITLTGNQVGGLFSILPITSNIGSTVASPVDKATFDPGAVTIGSNTVTYTYTDGNGCTNTNVQQVIVNPVTSIDFIVSGKATLATGEIPLCAEEGLLKLIGNPIASTGGVPETGFFAAGPAGPDSTTLASHIQKVGAEYYLQTNGLPSKSYVLVYVFKNGYNAISKQFHSILVYPSPRAAFASTNNCVVSAINFTDNSTIDPSTLPATSIVNYIWDFGDLKPKQYFSSPFTSTSYTYGSPNSYNVLLQVTTDQGCTNISAPYVLKVGNPPTPRFSWSSICTNDSTKFVDNSKPGVVSTITNYQWDFGDGTIINGAPGTPIVDAKTGGIFDAPRHKYATNGTYLVKIKVTNNNGCFDTSPTKKVFILPYNTITPKPNSAYTEDFEANDGGWIPEAFNALNSTAKDTIASDTSWVWGIPNGANVIKPTTLTNNSWWTGRNSNSYYLNENSVVNGPCFNLSKLNRPMVSLDYIVNTDDNTDGAVMQYSVDGGLTWQLVGPLAGLPIAQRDQGINWYKPGAIVTSNPGEQPAFGPYGWTGSSSAGVWRTGKFNLDMIPWVSSATPADSTRKQVRVRIAFASKSEKPGLEGFAFDNFFVGDKTKNVLVEHFTNATLAASLAGDSYFNNLYAAEINLRYGKTDFNDIQYHIRFPQADVFNQGNTNDDPAARALYYNVQQAPYSVMDGIQASPFSTGSYNAITPVEIDRRALRKPMLSITKIDTLSTSSAQKINLSVTVRADTAITFPLYAQAVLIENPVVITAPSPNPGTYQNVVRKLLFGGDGVTTNQAMAANDTQVFSKGEITLDANIKDATKLSVMVFIQNFATKEILQSALVPIGPKKGVLVTGIEPQAGVLDDIKIYPNPANGKFSFALPGELPTGSIWKISDQRGINVMQGDFSDEFNGVKAVDVSSLVNGVYFVAIGAPGKNPVYKKLIVLNSN
jgi:hypothetical protein